MLILYLSAAKGGSIEPWKFKIKKDKNMIKEKEMLGFVDELIELTEKKLQLLKDHRKGILQHLERLKKFTKLK